MPLALVDGELVVERKPLGLPEEMRKPVVCVFDPVVAVHAVILDRILGALRDKVDIFWISLFSRTCIELGGISERAYPVLIAVKKPILLISELEVTPPEAIYGPAFLFGIEMLQNLRRTEGLGNIPLIVISGADCLLKMFGGAGKELGKLKVNQFFTWRGLEKLSTEQKRLFDFVSQVLGLKTEP